MLIPISFLLALHAHAAEVPLRQAFESALHTNESVRSSHEQVIQAEERVSRVKGGLFPEISFQGNYQIQDKPEDPLARAFSPSEQTTANFSATQPLFRGFREFAGLRQQKRLLEAEKARETAARQTLYQETASRYLNVLSLEQDKKNLSEQAEIYGKRVKELRKRTRRGESSSTELLSAESSKSSVEAELRLVSGQLRAARENLYSYTGLPPDTRLKDPNFPLKTEKLETYLARMENRPDVSAARAEAEAADEGTTVAKGGHWPTIDAVGNYYLKRPGILDDIKWDVSFRLSLPIFSGGTVKAEVGEAAAKSSQAELELARARREAGEEIRSLYETIQARIEQLKFLKQSTELAQKNVAISQKEFRRGLIRNIDVQLALSDYRSARRTLDQTHFASQLDLLRLEIAAAMHPEGEPP